jgi:hypothetical protein
LLLEIAGRLGAVGALIPLYAPIRVLDEPGTREAVVRAGICREFDAFVQHGLFLLLESGGHDIPRFTSHAAFANGQIVDGDLALQNTHNTSSTSPIPHRHYLLKSMNLEAARRVSGDVSDVSIQKPSCPTGYELMVVCQ